MQRLIRTPYITLVAKEKIDLFDDRNILEIPNPPRELLLLFFSLEFQF